MKKIFTLFSITLLAIFTNGILLAQSSPDNDHIEALNAFKRLAEAAHPTPAANPQSLPMVPLAQTITSPIFLNSSMSVDEGGNDQMQNESSIVVNPLNPKNIISSAVDYRDNSATWVYVSNDGGKSWRNINLGRPYSGWSASNDPSVAFDMDGNGYLVNGAFGISSDSNGISYGENGVFLSKTTDQGATWNAHIPVITHRAPQTIDSAFEDKYYITIDNCPTSPYFNNCYIPWKRVTPKDSATQIVISRSTDRGMTWSQPASVSDRLEHSSEDTTYGQSFPLALAGPNGDVYVVWNNGIEHGVGFAVSHDAGLTFSAPRIIFQYNIFGKTARLSGQGWRHSVKGVVRAETYPSLAVDTRPGARQGWLYLTWCGDNPPNVYFSRSTDGGANWSQPSFVSQDTTNDQFFQWIAIDPVNGDLAVIYLDSRLDPSNIATNCFASYSSDAGITWTDRCVSDTSFDLRLNPFTGNSFAGDYNGCSFYDGIIYPSWVDMRHATTNIFDNDAFTALINTKSPLPPQDFKAKTIPDDPHRIELSWTPTTESTFGRSLSPADIKYILLRNDTLVTTLNGTASTYSDDGLMAYDEYKYSICAYSGADTSIYSHSSAFTGGSPLPAAAAILSLRGNANNTVDLTVGLPRFRSDSITPLVNLHQIIIYRDSLPVDSTVLNSSDTGRTVIVHDYPPERGFYNYMTRIADGAAPQNLSALSNRMLCYSGPVDRAFDEAFVYPQLAKYLYSAGWGTASAFYHSPGYSLTESPVGNYLPLKQYTFTIFPIDMTGSEPLVFNFWHAAIVDPSDSAVVEISHDNGSSWSSLASFNKNDFPAWMDAELNQDDWKAESIVLQPSSDTSLIRFRLKTNAVRNDDGWYIDDIKIDTYTRVEDAAVAGPVLNLYPNPCVNHINLDMNPSAENLTVSIMNIYGATAAQYEYGQDAPGQSIDVSSLAQGTYYLVAKSGRTAACRTFSIVR